MPYNRLASEIRRVTGVALSIPLLQGFLDEDRSTNDAAVGVIKKFLLRTYKHEVDVSKFQTQRGMTKTAVMSLEACFGGEAHEHWPLNKRGIIILGPDAQKVQITQELQSRTMCECEAHLRFRTTPPAWDS